jgi:hypothetical protein
MTGALIDRLTHRVHILEANGQSFRLGESKKRLRQKGKKDEKEGKDQKD